jgi:hypothetical protein
LEEDIEISEYPQRMEVCLPNLYAIFKKRQNQAEIARLGM